MIYKLYRFLSSSGKNLIKSHLYKRLSLGKEDSVRLSERMGNSDKDRPDGSLIWFHAASVGESLSILPLINRLLEQDDSLHILVTTGTIASARMMQIKLPNRCIHQYIPLDVRDWAQSFLDHWRPNLSLWVEAEIWPNLIYESHQRKIPLIRLNARVSDKSFRWWRFFRFITADILEKFDLCFAQSHYDLEKLKKLGAKNIHYHGNLKYASDPLPYVEEDLTSFRKSLGDRPVWVAASTHRGEEKIALDVHQKLKRLFPDILTILIPRHIERGNEINALIKEHHLISVCRSQKEPLMPETDIYLADTLGEMGLFYRASPIVFVGGSLVPIGGHNLIEPAQIGCALLHGNYMTNCLELARDFKERTAAIEVADSHDLVTHIAHLLKHPHDLRGYQTRAQETSLAGKKALDLILLDLKPYLEDM